MTRGIVLGPSMRVGIAVQVGIRAFRARQPTTGVSNIDVGSLPALLPLGVRPARVLRQAAE
jgi:hypothetical protein